MEVPAAAFGEYFIFFPYPFLFFCEGIKLALGRAAAANKKQKKNIKKKNGKI